MPTIEAQFVTGTTRLTNAPLTTTLLDILSEASVDGVVAGGQALATRPDFTALLPKIAVPTLVLVGVDDPIYGIEISETTRDAVPGALLAIIPQAEHTSIFEQPGFANAVIAQWAARQGLK